MFLRVVFMTQECGAKFEIELWSDFPPGKKQTGGSASQPIVDQEVVCYILFI